MKRLVGDERARAGAAPGAHRDALRLRPADEIGHDEEIARKLHRRDDAKLELQPRRVGLARDARDEAARAQPLLETRDGLVAQGLRLGRLGVPADAAREARQQRRALGDAVGAHARDLDRLVDGFRQVREERGHLGAGAEEMGVGQPRAPLVLDELGIGDAAQRVMRLVVGCLGVEALVGCEERQAPRVRLRDQPGLDGRAVAGLVALQLDPEVVAVEGKQALQPLGGGALVTGRQRHVDGAAGPARHGEEPLGVPGQRVPRHVDGRLVRLVEIGGRGERH